MDKCRTCGGTLINVGNGVSQCLYCRNEYKENDNLNLNFFPTSKGVAQQKDHGVDVYENNINGVLEIRWSDDRYIHSGSGLLITKQGYALTNTHVVTHENGESCDRVNVRINGYDTYASVVKLGDDEHGNGSGIDLALIKLDEVPKNAKALTFTNSDLIKNGERIFVIGNSLGYGTCITNGIVSDKSRNVDGKNLIMTDCAVNGGNSGGPVFNDKGQVLGVIVSGISAAEGMNFAIPSNDAIGFIRRSKKSFSGEHKSILEKYGHADNGKRINRKCSKCNELMNFEDGWAYCEYCDEARFQLYCPHCGRNDSLEVLSSGNLSCSACYYYDINPASL